MKSICLVACVSSKKHEKAPAQELYISPLFQKAQFYAANRFDQWFILSAKYGLVDPEQEIEPYEQTLNKMPKSQRDEWADCVFRNICSKVTNGSYIAFLAGERYREGLINRLREHGYVMRVPLEKLSIGRQLSWLKKIHEESERLQHLDKFYSLLNKLEQGIGGKRILKDCTGAIYWPKMGVYFFFESGEFRTSNVTEDRVVRVGTHTVSKGSKTTLWNRLRTHRGGLDQSGNHRGSIFRLHVGFALMNRSKDNVTIPTWGNGQTASKEIRIFEADVERKVSNHIGNMSLLWIAVNDEPSATNDRAYIEQNAIALLAGKSGPIDIATPEWLGRYSSRDAIKNSGLWNVNYVENDYDPRFLDVLSTYVDVTLGKISLPKGSIAPAGWAIKKRNQTHHKQLSIFKED